MICPLYALLTFAVLLEGIAEVGRFEGKSVYVLSCELASVDDASRAQDSDQ